MHQEAAAAARWDGMHLFVLMLLTTAARKSEVLNLRWRDVDLARGFAILRASLYRTPEGQGTYLMKGDRVEFTRGPMRGTVMIRVAPRLLRIVEKDGTPGRLRCHRAGPVPD